MSTDHVSQEERFSRAPFAVGERVQVLARTSTDDVPGWVGGTVSRVGKLVYVTTDRAVFSTMALAGACHQVRATQTSACLRREEPES